MLLIRLCAVAVALLQFDVVAQRSTTPENDAIAQKLNREVCTPSATHIKQLDDIPRAAYLLEECGALRRIRDGKRRGNQRLLEQHALALEQPRTADQRGRSRAEAVEQRQRG